MCQHFSYSYLNSGSKVQQQRAWKSLVKEICVADILANMDSTALSTIQQGDYLLRPIEFIKKSDRCFLITEYANGPRVSDILKIRKENGSFLRINPAHESEGIALDEFADSNPLDGFLSDGETQIVMQQVVEIVNDLYENRLSVYDLSPDNFLTHFEHSTQLLSTTKPDNQTDAPIEKLGKPRSNTISLSETEQKDSLMQILFDRKMSIKLMAIGLKNKYELKDCLLMAPDSVL